MASTLSADLLLRCVHQIPSYIQICGIILGMITIGYLGDRIGRKWGSVTTVSIMGVRRSLRTIPNSSRLVISKPMSITTVAAASHTLPHAMVCRRCVLCH